VTFATWPVLWVAMLCPFAVAGLYLYDRWRRGQLVRYLGELPVIGRVIGSASPGRRLAKTILAGLGLALVVFALARPQIAGTRRVELRGLDLVVAVDVSKSMRVDDVVPDRLERARELAGKLIAKLPGDRIGPVVFAGAAAHFPLTEDRDVAAHFFGDLGPADLPPGSNLAEVFRVARCMLRPDLYDDLGCAKIGRRGHGGDPMPGESLDPKDKPSDEVVQAPQTERGKAIAIFTDGGDADADALREVATARELGIAVFVVGFGTPAGGVVHEIDEDGKATAQVKHARDGQVVVSKRDDAGMKALAAAGGDEDRYFVAPERGELDPAPIVAALHEVDRGLATKRVAEQRDIYQPFLFAGFMLLVIEVAIATRRRRRFPEEP